jgi:hypothetical protein
MHYERLVLEAGENTVSLRFHPRLTVVAGVGTQERDLLVAELFGGLTGGRPGVYLEVRDQGGYRIGITRRSGVDTDRVVELDSGQDVTEEFAPAATGSAGRLDLLSMMGLSADKARARYRLTAGELAVHTRADATIAALAALDQPRLWAAAGRLVAAEQVVAREARQADAAAEDAPLAEEIERRHAAFEAAQRRTRGARRATIFVAGSCAPAAGVALALHARFTAVGWLAVRLGALGLVGIAAVMTMVSVLFRHRAEAARRAENAALEAVGAESYFGFELQRIDSLIADQQALARMAAASEEHRRALTAWQAVASDVDPHWVLAQREAITERAQAGPSGLHARIDVDPLRLAQWLTGRFAAARRAGATGESLPLVLDDPLVALNPGVKAWALGMVSRFAGSAQVIYLTADRDVIAWARVEAMSGELSVVDAVPERVPTRDRAETK